MDIKPSSHIQGQTKIYDSALPTQGNHEIPHIQVFRGRFGEHRMLKMFSLLIKFLDKRHFRISPHHEAFGLQSSRYWEWGRHNRKISALEVRRPWSQLPAWNKSPKLTFIKHFSNSVHIFYFSLKKCNHTDFTNEIMSQ